MTTNHVWTLDRVIEHIENEFGEDHVNALQAYAAAHALKLLKLLDVKNPELEDVLFQDIVFWIGG